MKKAINVLISIYIFSLPLPAQQMNTYRVVADMDISSRIINGTVELKWKVATDTDSIPFAFQYKTELNKHIKKATVNGEKVHCTQNQGPVKGFYLRPKQRLAKGDTVIIDLTFASDTIVDPFNYGYIQAVGNWLPMIPSYRDGRFWWSEKDLKHFHLVFSMPKHWVAIMTGPVGEEKLNQGKKIVTSLVHDVTEFGICLSDKFRKETTDANGITLISYFFEHDLKWGRKLLDMARDVVLFYKEKIGFYPAQQVSILPGGPRPIGGYPISSNMFVIHRGLDQRDENFANWITAHELAHFYWGSGYILSDNTYPAWFGLSMGIYTDWIYSKHKNLDLSVYNFHYRFMAGYMAGFNTTILQPIEQLKRAGFDYNNIIAHGKSFVVLQMLEQYIGADIFLGIFNEFLAGYKGRTVDYGLFKHLCTQRSGKDLDWFFEQWYETNKILDYRISDINLKYSEEEMEITARLRRYGDAIMPFELEVKRGEQKYAMTLPGDFSDTTIHFKVKPGLFAINIDPHHRLPMLSRYENDSAANRLVINYLLNTRKNYNLVPRFLGKIQRTDTTSTVFLLNGIASRGSGNLEAAVTYFEKGRLLNRDAGAAERCLLELAKTYDLVGARQQALRYYTECLSKPGVSDNARQFIGKPFQNTLF